MKIRNEIQIKNTVQITIEFEIEGNSQMTCHMSFDLQNSESNLKQIYLNIDLEIRSNKS